MLANSVNERRACKAVGVKKNRAIWDKFTREEDRHYSDVSLPPEVYAPAMTAPTEADYGTPQRGENQLT
jgi:hypothetical protein